MSIDRSAYSDPAVFGEEVSRLFGSRMYIGSAFDLPTVNDYKSLRFGGHAITVRRTEGGVRAFNNVCLHRNALIDPLGTGNRAFRCNYHGWSYGDSGTLKHAPLADDNAICDRRLAEYLVGESNGLYFIGQRGIPDVSDVALAFDKTDSILNEPFYHDVLHHACNWKLLVENVLEGYHLSHVHKDTFLSAGFSSNAKYDIGNMYGVSWAKLTPAQSNNKTRSLQRLSSSASHFYSHAYIFPNFFISNTNGLIGFQGSLLPLSADTTLLDWALFELPALKCLAVPIREQIKSEAVNFTIAALLEDKVLVQSCQLGLSADGAPYQLQPGEGRIVRFHALYQEKMSCARE